MEAFELWSSTLYPFLDPRTQRWVIAFDEDGTYYGSSNPGDDFYMPVPDSYATKAGAEAAINVLKVWDAPVARDEQVLDPARLRATPEWRALVPFFPEAEIGLYSKEEFDEAFELTGANADALEHYHIMLWAGIPAK
jgi:hypothetical protein